MVDENGIPEETWVDKFLGIWSNPYSCLQAVVTIVIALVIGVSGVMNLVGPIEDQSDYYTYLAATLLAFIGVSITGYIFLIESIRKLTERNRVYSDSAEKMRQNILDKLTTSLLAGIAFTIVCGILSVAKKVNSSPIIVGLIALAYATLIIYSLRLNWRMMSYKSTMKTIAKDTAKELCKKLRDEPLILYASPVELEDMLDTGDAINGGFETNSRVKKIIYFAKGENHIQSAMSRSGKRSFKKGNKVLPVPKSIMDLIKLLEKDRFVAESWMTEREIALPPERFDAFGAECDVEFDPGEHDTLKLSLEEDPGNGPTLTIVKEKNLKDISGTTKSIIAHKDMRDEFDINNVMKVFNDSETLIFRMVGLEYGVLDEGDYQKLGTILGVSTYGDYGLAEDIINRYRELKRFHDAIIVGNEDKHALDYKLSMMGPAYALRYEISKKLSDLDFSRMNLSFFDFSYGIMRNTILKESVLTNAVFYKTRLPGTNMDDCDISNAMFMDADLDRCTFNRSKLNATKFNNVSISKVSFTDSEVSNVQFNGLGLSDVTFNGSHVRSTSFVYSDLDHSNFHDATLMDIKFEECHMTNAVFIGCTASESRFLSDVLYGSNFRESMMGNAEIVNSRLSECEFTNSNITSALLMESTFTNTSCENVNFTGTVILCCKFETSLLSGSEFVNAFIGSRMLGTIERNWVAKDNALIEHEKIITNGIRGIVSSVLKQEETSEKKSDPHSDVTRIDNKYRYAREPYEKIRDGSANLLNMVDRISVFDHSTMEDCLFTETEISDAQMRFVILNGSRFNNSRITNSSLEGSILNNMSLSRCTLANVNFDNTAWNGTSLSDIKCDYCDFCSTSLSGVSMVSVVFNGCNMQNSAFSGSKIIDCHFVDMIIPADLMKVVNACTFTRCTFESISENTLGADTDCKFHNCTFINSKCAPEFKTMVKDCTFVNRG